MAVFGLHRILTMFLWKKLEHNLVIVISVALRLGFKRRGLKPKNLTPASKSDKLLSAHRSLEC